MSVQALIDLEALFFVYGLLCAVGYGLLTSRINLKGLLTDKSGARRVRPERVQLLLATIVLGGRYLNEISKSPTPSSFPALDSNWLYLFGGSSGVYVARKLYERFVQ